MSDGFGARYLFVPDRVEETLAGLPTLATLLGPPAVEGDPARAFPRARSSPRQIYRLLVATHYPHIAALLEAIEFSFARGWRDEQLLRTASRARLRGAISEAVVVEALLHARFEIEAVPRGAAASPDIRARRDGLVALVEVYAPRTWEGLEDFVEDGKDWLKHLDEPYDYDFGFHLSHLRLFGEDGRLRWFDAFGFSAEVERPSRRLDELAGPLGDALKQLRDGEREIEVKVSDDALDVEIAVSINSVRAAEQELPVRGGTFAPPGLSGYSDEGIFALMLQRGLQRKLGKRQAVGGEGGELAVLVVDLSHLQVDYGLEDEIHLRHMHEVLAENVDAAAIPYDVILFVRPRGTGPGAFGLRFDVVRTGASASAAELVDALR